MSENKNTKGITVRKEDDMPSWYSQVVVKSELADYSPVKGCIIIRPYGYAIWQKMMDFFNERIKQIGVENAYFPLFIPESFFKKEANHVEGFAPELAWVDRKGDSEERLAIRPTSETIMYDSYAKWIRSHRDLPLRINQWCNVVRWEVSDVKIFLRGREFLWQEGHCVYATKEECDEEVLLMIQEYQKLSQELLAVPAHIGLKSEREKFPGAYYTYTIESFMPDGKALQSGTSHNLGQGFAKAFNIKFKGKDAKEHIPWQSSWGFSTRMIGSMIMTHSDNKGLVLPPKVAPVQAVIVPITLNKKPELSKKVLDKAHDLKQMLEKENIRVKLDDRDEHSPGYKFNEWELKGVPIRIELGPKDLEKEQCVLVKRNDGEKLFTPLSELAQKLPTLLETIQQELFDKAKTQVEQNTERTDDYKEFLKHIENKKLIITHHCGEAECELKIKEETSGATTRCRPYGQDKADKGATCIKCQKPAAYKIIFAKNY